jgi:hypothetical protein
VRPNDSTIRSGISQDNGVIIEGTFTTTADGSSALGTCRADYMSNDSPRATTLSMSRENFFERKRGQEPYPDIGIKPGDLAKMSQQGAQYTFDLW